MFDFRGILADSLLEEPAISDPSERILIMVKQVMADWFVQYELRIGRLEPAIDAVMKGVPEIIQELDLSAPDFRDFGPHRAANHFRTDPALELSLDWGTGPTTEETLVKVGRELVERIIFGALAMKALFSNKSEPE